jgi:hypothetical protein
VVVSALIALGSVAGVDVAGVAQAAPFASAKSCSSGWTHAVIGGEHKCLRAGQFCRHELDRQYHRYGYHCHKYDSSIDRYRLTR